jgi:hypothetical protein
MVYFRGYGTTVLEYGTNFLSEIQLFQDASQSIRRNNASRTFITATDQHQNPKEKKIIFIFPKKKNCNPQGSGRIPRRSIRL